jgi:hypothetical protein
VGFLFVIGTNGVAVGVTAGEVYVAVGGEIVAVGVALASGGAVVGIKVSFEEQAMRDSRMSKAEVFNRLIGFPLMLGMIDSNSGKVHSEALIALITLL